MDNKLGGLPAWVTKIATTIENAKAENATLKTKIEQMQEAIAYDMKNYLAMQAENERLRLALEDIVEISQWDRKLTRHEGTKIYLYARDALKEGEK